MIRTLAVCVLLVSQLTIRGVSQPAPASSQSAEAVCTFDDGKQLKVEYHDSTAKGPEKFHDGKIWEPGGSPMFLFTQAPLGLAGSVIPEGAYSLYVIPEKNSWTLVVNRNVAATNVKYDEQQDLVRAPMGIGQIHKPIKPAQIAFDHIAPKQCNLRLYYETTGAWAELHEK
ncbi:MAG: DUF2911 domain-containing protein [Terriglobales bacterium]|jgi:hypothetical protein